MKFYTYRKEELAAINNFRVSCVKDNLEIIVSRRAIAALSKVVSSRSKRVATDVLGASSTAALSRRGFIREEADGNWVVTELGLLVLAYAEVGGLLESKEMAE